MNRKILTGFILALCSFALGATDIVWTAANGNGTKAPASWYSFTYGTGSGVDTSFVNSYKVVDFTASSSGSNGAGYGLNWKQDVSYKAVAISLSSYKGVCLAYKAEHPLRIDFKQSTITDDNYYGMSLAAASTFKSVFISFASLSQDWTSSVTVPWSVAKQTGLQFSYKNTLAEDYGTTNKFVLSSLILGDSCVTVAPVIDENYAADTNVILNEGDTLTYPLVDVFSDADGDSLTITVSISGTAVTLLNEGSSFTLSDTLRFVPAINKADKIELIITATDPTGKSVKYKVNVTVYDKDNAPTAVNDKYETDEETKLVVDYSDGVFNNDYDLDDDKFLVDYYSEAKHGTFTMNKNTSAFTYTPEKDFYGTDTIAYILKEDKNVDIALASDTAKIIIQVNNVNDAPTLNIVDSALTYGTLGTAMKLGDTIKVDEDFGSFDVFVPIGNITFADPDGDGTLTIGAKSDPLVSVGYKKTSNNSDYVVTVSSVLNANGVAKVTLFATDKLDTVGVSFYVEIAPVADAPIAVADSFTIVEDSLLTVTAAKGVLANDYSPDGDDVVLTAKLVTSASHGVVTLEEDGSFTYQPETDFFGADSFSYKALDTEEAESVPAKVKITVTKGNNAPVVALDSAFVDTTVNEDFTSQIRYNTKVVTSWFSDREDDKLYYSVASADGKLSVSITAANIVIIKSVKDSCGDAVIVVSATDSVAGHVPAEFEIHVAITPVNDIPRQVDKDTVFEENLSDFAIEIDLDTIFFDPEGDAMAYELIGISSGLSGDIEDNILTVTPETDSTVLAAKLFVVRVKARDDDTTGFTGAIYIRLGTTDAIPFRLEAPSISWQQAILGNRGTAKLYDLKGQLLWQGALPATESAVRNAAMRSQGNTILRLNGSRWTLSSESLR